MKTPRLNGSNCVTIINASKINRIQHRTFLYLIKFIPLMALALFATGCVSIDRALNPLTNQTKHYSFNYEGVSNGGLVVAGVVGKYQELDASESIEISQKAQRVFKQERDEFDVQSAEAMVGSISISLKGDGLSVIQIGKHDYRQIMEMYQRERWVKPELLSIIREATLQRFAVFARIDDTSESQSSYCGVREAYEKQQKREEESGEQEDYEEDKYYVSRSSSRYATISIDVIDLAQDIIVWSATGDGSVTYSESYNTNAEVGEYEYLDSFPYPDYPSWSSAYRDSFYGFAVHLPHESDK